MRVALIAGYGKMPYILFDELKQKGHDIIVININNTIEHSFAEKKVIPLTLNLEEFLATLKKEQISHVAFAGKVNKGKIIKSLSYSLKSHYNSVKRGDLDLLTALKDVLSYHGIQVLDLREYLKRYITQEKCYTKATLTSREWEDIYFGAPYAKTIADMEIGQSIIVEDKMVYAVEAIEGTNECMRRTKNYGLEAGVLIKVGRTGQGFNLEVPIVGFETVKVASESNIGIIAVEKGTTLFIEREEAIPFAEEKGIKIVGFSLEGER